MVVLAEAVLAEATQALGLNLARLVALAALWVHPDVVAALAPHFPGGLWFPGYRRARTGAGERPKTRLGDLRLDDNSAANLAIKQALFAQASAGCCGFHVCHVWAETCYDVACHTALANLVLIPAPLAGLTDYDPEIAAMLRYRSWQLYGWHPVGKAVPPAPDGPAALIPWRALDPPSAQVMARVARKLAIIAPAATAVFPDLAQPFSTLPGHE